MVTIVVHVLLIKKLIIIANKKIFLIYLMNLLEYQWDMMKKIIRKILCPIWLIMCPIVILVFLKNPGVPTTLIYGAHKRTKSGLRMRND